MKLTSDNLYPDFGLGFAAFIKDREIYIAFLFWNLTIKFSK